MTWVGFDTSQVPNIDCYIPGMAFLCIVITSESAKLGEYQIVYSAPRTPKRRIVSYQLSVSVLQSRQARRSDRCERAHASPLRTSPKRRCHTVCAPNWARSCQRRRSSAVSRWAARSAPSARSTCAQTRHTARRYRQPPPTPPAPAPAIVTQRV